ncbi:hypothetical protein EDC01DRAFT_617365 [Geopyxis carbonaria]|nr:hypothetical protein EDC01DRAFT_617365 [Geopyxis carbonaria]
MPPADKHVLAYAAGASLAAATLIYVFGPTWPMDASAAEASARQRKKCVVGLANPANDCFINSILQALAGLEDLRAYLIRRMRVARTRGEGGPYLTAALKEILDSLNERPLHRKTISNRPFLLVLERVFRQQISRAQQDAHEFLQVVAETLAEEHDRQKKAVLEKKAGEAGETVLEGLDGSESGSGSGSGSMVILSGAEGEEEEGKGKGREVVEEAEVEDGRTAEVELEFGTMPLEGKLRSEIECQTCGFRPKPTVSTFVVLTLPVPQKSSTSLAECIDGTLSTEPIDDFHCAKCTLQHTLSVLTSLPTPPASTIATLTHHLTTNPEAPLPPLPIPPPPPQRRRISKQTSIASYPSIIALHLQRSIYDTFASRKNSAKVAFGETLTLGPLRARRAYRLLCVVTHKGGHESGHYECFRRQMVARAPYSTPSPSPRVGSPVPSVAGSVFSSNGSSGGAGAAEEAGREWAQEAAAGKEKEKEKERMLKVPGTSSRKSRRKRRNDRWWRISDDKIKEASTADVLGMQKEVYLLFYQRVKDGEGEGEGEGGGAVICSG